MAGGKLRLFACRSGKEFASKVAEHLNRKLEEEKRILNESIHNCNHDCYFYSGEREKLGNVVVESYGSDGLVFREFANGEYYYKIKDEDKYSVRGDKAYVIQLTEKDPALNLSIHDNIFELIVLLDMLNRSGVEETNLIIPILPYSRQDAQSGREPIMTRRLAKIFETSLINSLITIDVHSKSAIDNAYDIKKELLYASKIIIPALVEELNGDISNLVLVSTDAGGAKKVKYYAKEIGVDAVISFKERIKANLVDSVSIRGDIEGKDVCFVDDIIDTGGTIIKSIEEAHLKGARNIYIICTHPLFNGDAAEKFENLYLRGMLKKVIGTDTVNKNKEFLEKYKWFKQVAVSELFADVIFCSFMKRPVSSVYKPAEKF